MLLSLLPLDLLQYEICCYLDFKDSIKWRMTDKFFNDSYSYHHDPRLDRQYGILQASRAGNLNAISNILKQPYADPAFDGSFALRTAILNGHSEIVSLLLNDNRIKPEELNFNPFRQSIRAGYLETLKLLLKDKRLNPGANNNEAIKNAVLYHDVNVVGALLNDSRVDPNTGAFAMAAGSGDIDILNIFIADPRVDPALDNNLAIRRAARRGNSIVVKALLTLKSRGVDPGETVDGMNALDEALIIYSIWNFETAELILPHVEPTFSTLFRVAHLGYLDYVKLLLNDCRINLTKHEINMLIRKINVKNRFPKIMQLKFEELKYIGAREDKKEVIFLLRNHKKRGSFGLCRGY
jgi:ankyrin repeat protein